MWHNKKGGHCFNLAEAPPHLVLVIIVTLNRTSSKMKQAIPRARVAPNIVKNDPPTPPPMPSFLKSKSVTIAPDGVSKDSRVKVKLILPHDPPGETSTDDHISAYNEIKVSPIRKARAVQFSNHPTDDVRCSQGALQGQGKRPPLPRRTVTAVSRSRIERLVFSGQVFNIMSATVSLLALAIFLAVFFINKTESVNSPDILDDDIVTDTLIQELAPWSDDNNEVYRRFSLKNTRGLELVVMSYGATVTNLILPDQDDIVLGFDSIQDYQGKDNPYFGATVGRVANRIKTGQFTLEGVQYNLTVNNGPNTLHGGVVGWDKANWRSSIQGDAVVFSLMSNDGDQGFPGNILATSTYR